MDDVTGEITRVSILIAHPDVEDPCMHCEQKDTCEITMSDPWCERWKELANCKDSEGGNQA